MGPLRLQRWGWEGSGCWLPGSLGPDLPTFPTFLTGGVGCSGRRKQVKFGEKGENRSERAECRGKGGAGPLLPFPSPLPPPLPGEPGGSRGGRLQGPGPVLPGDCTWITEVQPWWPWACRRGPALQPSSRPLVLKPRERETSLDPFLLPGQTDRPGQGAGLRSAGPASCPPSSSG